MEMEREAGFRKKEAARGAQKEIRAGSKRGWRSYTGPQQLLLHGDERGNRSWERGGSVKIWECSGAGISAVQRQAAQGLGRICEAGTATRWGRNEREPGSHSPERGTGDPAMAMPLCGDQRAKQQNLHLRAFQTCLSSPGWSHSGSLFQKEI